MATDLSFVEYIADQSQIEGRLTHRKMFGEYALYLDGKVVALVCDNSLFVKPADSTASLTAGLPQRPPYPGARLHPVADSLLDEPELLRDLLLATWKAMPEPKPKAKPKAKTRARKKPARAVRR